MFHCLTSSIFLMSFFIFYTILMVEKHDFYKYCYQFNYIYSFNILLIQSVASIFLSYVPNTEIQITVFYLMMSACRSQRRHRGSGRRATRVLLNELSSTLYTCTLVSIVLGVGSIEAGLISIEFSLSLGSTSVHCDNWYYHGYCSYAPTKNQRNISR